MVWLLLLIPTILSVVALLLFKHKLTWWEVLLPTAVCVIIMGIMNGIFLNNTVKDTEYLSEFPIEARYYEKWDEYIHQTCEDTCCCDEDGMNCVTTTYDCSYVDTHRERWNVLMNTGNVVGISKSYYNYLIKLWEGKTIFKDMNRDYHMIDGDMYYEKWDKIFDHIEPKTFSQTYTNKPQAATTVFKFKELDSIEKIGLYDYPKVVNRTQVNCLGCSSSDDEYLRKYNALLGKRYEIKIYILVFDNKSLAHSELQKVYWKGGNKNELVITMDKNSEWVNTFSWMDDKSIQVETNELFRNKNLSLRDKISQLDKLVRSKWKRKHFADFEYIQISLTSSQVTWIAVVVIILSIGILTFGVLNDIDQDVHRRYKSYRRFGNYR